MRGCSLFLLLASASPAAAQMLPGDLLVNSMWNPELLVHFRPDGTVVQTSGPGTGKSWVGAVILPDGNWLTTRWSPHGVNIFDGVTGAEIATWDLPGFTIGAGDVGLFSDGTIAISEESGRVWRYDTTGVLIAKWKVSGRPGGILVDSQDHVWTCDRQNGVLWHTDDKGNKLGEFPTGGAAGDVTMARDGTLFVTRIATNEVAHYAQDGTFLGAFKATNNPQTFGIAMGSDDSLWVSSTQDLLLRNFDQAGNLLGSFHRSPVTLPLFMTVAVQSGDYIGTNYCGPANLNSTGQSAVIVASGSAQASKNFVQLAASRLPSGVFGYFLNSDVQGFQPFPPGSQGNLCLGGSLGRHAKQVTNSGVLGELYINLDLTALPRPGGTHTVVAGETWNFQCWFRDDNGGPTSNFTDGIEIVFQ